MQDQKFHRYLQQDRGHQKNSADSYRGRAKARENDFGIDPDDAARLGLTPDLIEKTYAQKDLSENTRNSYASALRLYAQFGGA
jgi:hypothetical protein